MVLVDLLLQFGSLFQQRPILRDEISHNLAERFPEPIGVHTGARRDLISDKLIQFFINLKPTYLNEVRHAFSSSINFCFGLLSLASALSMSWTAAWGYDLLKPVVGPPHSSSQTR